jgi:predicted dienelactone hydrolase
VRTYIDGYGVEYFRLILLAGLYALCSVGYADEPPARPGVDAPELAALGPYAAGVTSLELVQPDQLNPLEGESAAAPFDRALSVRMWYPAVGAGSPITYRSALPGPDTKLVPFTIPGIAISDAPRAQGRFPLVILAHGASNTPEVLAWLGENLATKGYIVAAPAFADPPISERAKISFPVARRPLDIAFVAAELRRLAGAHSRPFEGLDPSRVALIGYSLGGYGVITAAGAPLNPKLGPATRGALTNYVAGAARASDLIIPDIKAVVAISPALRIGPLELWAPGGLAEIRAPTLLIVGSQDHLVGYDPGVRTIFDGEIHAPRYLLTFHDAGHNIGMSGSPAEMQGRLWDKDWFEDPVWRKARLNAIEAHFITALLDRYVKDDTAKASYIDGLIPDSNEGAWPTPPAEYGAYSPGPPTATLWKGFQERHATGMTFEFRPAAK